MNEKSQIVYGVSPEAYVALKLRDWVKSLSGREQLAVEKFADALECIPLALARNAGMNSIDSITQLHAKQNADEHFIGIDVINGTIADFEKLGIIEPLKVKEKIIKSATETANIILRIDNVIAVSCSASTEPPQGMPTGGGMY